MSSLHIRLNIGLEGADGHPAKPPSTFAADAAASASAAKDTTLGSASYYQIDQKISCCPEFDITYNDETTFSKVLRDVIEVHHLDGRLLDFLESNSQTREEVYVLMYSKHEATVIQPYWSSRSVAMEGKDDKRDCKGAESGRHNIMCQLILQLLLVGGGDTCEVVLEPDTLVSYFVQKYTSTTTVAKIGHIHDNYAKKRKVDEYNTCCFEMKLKAKLINKIDVNSSYYQQPSKINVLLCEEHFRHRGKLLDWNLLYTQTSAKSNSAQSSSSSYKTTSTLSTKAHEQHHIPLKSFLIHNFLINKSLLMAMAFLIPTTLILRGIDTIDGIQISVDKPTMCQSRLVNLERPAVLRQYFGLDLDHADGPDHLPPLEREDLVWRSCYGAGSGARTVGVHPIYSTTREMTAPMKIMADHIYNYLWERFKDDNSVVVLPFNHVTILLYYQKEEDDVATDLTNMQKSMIGYHTDNVYSSSLEILGKFLQEENSQVENTFTALLTLGDTRELHFRRQTLLDGQGRRKWTSDEKTLPFIMEHNSLFLLHPCDERPSQSRTDKPVHRYQHGDVKFPYPYKLSAALAFRAVTSKEKVYKNTGKLFREELTTPSMLPPLQDSIGDSSRATTMNTQASEPELDYLLNRFHQGKLTSADKRLKDLWLSVSYRHFQCQVQKQNR